MKQRTFKLIETRGIRLRCMVEGSGSGPLCVLVHGFPESWLSWRHLIEPLVGAGYRVAALDVRGYGGSDKPHAIEAYDLIELTDDVLGVIDALGGPDSKAILIGHDWGAPIVWTTAIRHSTRVRAVIGMSVPHLGRGQRPSIETFRHRFKDQFFYQIYFQTPGVAEAELEADVPTTLRKIFYNLSGADDAAGMSEGQRPDAKLLDGMIDPDPLPAWLPQEDLDHYVAQFRGSGFRGPLNRYRNYARDFALLPELSTKKVEQPAMFIAGERDPVLRFVPGVNLADVCDPYYTDLRAKVIVPGAGHWVQQETPEPVIAAVLKFLRELSGH
jgi:pimeloyl-ACP methyl ester carboxylesterase